MKRVQRKRTKGYRLPPNTVYVGRGSAWGNPFRIGKTIVLTPLEAAFVAQGDATLYRNLTTGFKIETRQQAIQLFYNLTLNYERSKFNPLQGKNLACWCPLHQKCHADILLMLANRKYTRAQIRKYVQNNHPLT